MSTSTSTSVYNEFQKELLKKDNLLLRTFKDDEWVTERLSGDSLIDFVNCMNVEYDESMLRIRSINIIDLYLN
jgi:hypothetical protein